jgi:hypothetical protein
LQTPSARAKYVNDPAAVGETANVLPVEIELPLQLPEYHFQLPPVPRLPPFIVRLLLLPRQIDTALAVIEFAGTEVSFTVIITLLHIVLLHAPSARTKYV